MTKLSPVTYAITMTVRAPFLFPGMNAGRFGMDAVALRNLDGDLVLPQDQLRGVAKYTASKMGRTDFVDLFGTGSDDARDEDTSNFSDSGRGLIFFGDLTCKSPKYEDKDKAERLKAPLPRVAISPETGAAQDGQLMMVEQCALPGDKLAFQGRVTIFTEDADKTETALQTVLQSIWQVGRGETIGFGEVVDCQVSTDQTKIDAPKTPEADRFTVTFTVDRPYLVAARRLADNVYKGSVTIPGGAIKGCLIRNLVLQGKSLADDELEKLKIGFASPVSAPKTAPLSVGIKDEKLIDVIEAGSWSGVTAQNSFKSEDEAIFERYFGQDSTHWEERVHTAINPKTGAARDAKLFSFISAFPPQEGFTTCVDVSGLSEDAKVKVKTAFGRPNFGLGKTGATILPVKFDTAPVAKPVSLSNNRLSLLIQTPALLVEPEEDAALEDLYRATWSQLLPRADMVSSHSTVLPEGGYLGRRYASDKGYRPFWLTHKGSIFVFTPRKGAQLSELAEDVEALCRTGVIKAQVDGRTPHWSTCPYVPENGYGEVTCNWALPTKTFDTSLEIER